ncbi:MAG: hypothetical protein P8Y80_05485 [Acidobacteriota bacterium]
MEFLYRDVPLSRIGTVLEERKLQINGSGGRKVIDMNIETLRRSFKETLYGI